MPRARRGRAVGGADALQGGVQADQRLVAQVGAGRGDVEGLGVGDRRHGVTGQRRLGTRRQDAAHPLEDARRRIGDPAVQPPVTRGQPAGVQQLIQQGRERARVAVGDVVGARPRVAVIQAEPQRGGDVLHGGHVDELGAVTEHGDADPLVDAQQARHQARIADADQPPGAQDDRLGDHPAGLRGDHQPLGGELAADVLVELVARVRVGLAQAEVVPWRGVHAGGGDQDEPARPVAVRELQCRPSARHVGALEVCSAAPRRREGGGVDDGVHVGAVLGQDAEIADDEVGGGVAQVAERGQVAAGGHHRVTMLGQIPHQVATEEAAGSGDQDACGAGHAAHASQRPLSRVATRAVQCPACGSPS